MADLNELSEKLSGIKAEIKEELLKLETSKSVFEYKKSIFDSKAGKVGSLMREMGKIPNEMKAEYGKRVNELKTWAQEKFDEMDEKFKIQSAYLGELNKIYAKMIKAVGGKVMPEHEEAAAADENENK